MVAKYSKEGEVDVDHTHAMRDLQYNNDIEDYIHKLKYYNEKAQLSSGPLKEVVRDGLPQFITTAMFNYDDLETTKGIWHTLQKADLKYEAVRKTEKCKELSGDKKEDKGKQGSSKSNNGNGKASNGTTPPKPNSEGMKEKKENSRFPKHFKSYHEANKGVPRDVVADRLKANLCTRCGKGHHNAKYCQGEAVKTSSRTKEVKPASTTAAVTTAPASTGKDESCNKCSHASTTATAVTTVPQPGYVEDPSDWPADDPRWDT